MVAALGTTPERHISLMGIGRGGCRIAHLVKAKYAFPGLRVIAADADADALRQCSPDEIIHLGEQWTHGEGCGGDMDLAERCVSASSNDLRDLLQRSRLMFVAAGLGGGIGSAGVRVLARLAREAAVPIVCLVTMPFSFEGGKRMGTAEQALAMLRQETEAVIAVPNSLLFSRLPPDTPGTTAFSMSSDLLAQALSGLARICCAQGLLTADLAGVKRIVRRPGSTCAIAIGCGQGENAADEAIQNFLDSPFVGGEHSLHDVDAALLTLLGGDELSIRSVEDCLGKLQSRFPGNPRVLVGAYTDSRLHGHIQLTGLLVREERKNAVAEPDLFGQADRKGGKSTRRTRSKGQEPAQPQDQDLLPFPDQQLGVFAGSSQPTFRNGENLDIPTFQRRNKRLDPGEDI